MHGDEVLHNKPKTNTDPQAMVSTLNKRSITTEPPPKNSQQPKSPAVGGLHFTGATSSP